MAGDIVEELENDAAGREDDNCLAGEAENTAAAEIEDAPAEEIDGTSAEASEAAPSEGIEDEESEEAEQDSDEDSADDIQGDPSEAVEGVPAAEGRGVSPQVPEVDPPAYVPSVFAPLSLGTPLVPPQLSHPSSVTFLLAHQLITPLQARLYYETIMFTTYERRIDMLLEHGRMHKVYIHDNPCLIYAGEIQRLLIILHECHSAMQQLPTEVSDGSIVLTGVKQMTNDGLWSCRSWGQPAFECVGLTDHSINQTNLQL